MGCDAGEFCGETGEDCEVGVPCTFELGETAELPELCSLPNIVSKRRRAPNHTLFVRIRIEEVLISLQHIGHDIRYEGRRLYLVELKHFLKRIAGVGFEAAVNQL